MPSSTFPSVITGVTVETATNGALSGDGSSGNKLAVGVDGVTIDVNGSNQLEALDVPAIDATYLTATDETGTLTGSRQLLAGTNITFDDTTPGERTINATGGGSFTPPVTVADDTTIFQNTATTAVERLDANGNIRLIGHDGDQNATAGFGFDASGNPFLEANAGVSFGIEPATSFTSTGITAKLTTAFADPNANLIWTATDPGPAGNALQVEYVDPGMADQSLSASYDTDTKVLTISLATDSGSVITSTAQDIIDLGSYDGAPMSPALAPGSDGTGVVEALSPQNLAGGLEALNVTGGSWLDNGAIRTNGSGFLETDSSVKAHQFQALNGDVAGTLVGYSIDKDDGLYAVDQTTADKNIPIAAQGAGTINLNSDTVGSGNIDAQSFSVDGDGGAVGGTFTSISSITVKNGIITAITGT